MKNPKGAAKNFSPHMKNPNSGRNMKQRTYSENVEQRTYSENVEQRTYSENVDVGGRRTDNVVDEERDDEGRTSYTENEL